MKNYFGGSVINYGSKLPTGSDIPDGSIFLKTVKSDSQPAGLYIYGVLQDSDGATLGDQSKQGWIEVNTGKINSGNSSDDVARDTDTALCPKTATLDGSGSFNLLSLATFATFTGGGSAGSQNSAGQNTLVLINGQILTFPGSARGESTLPPTTSKYVNLTGTGSNRQVQFSVPTGGTLSFCYSTSAFIPPPPPPPISYNATFPIIDCDNVIYGYAYQIGDVKDPMANVAITDCDSNIFGYIYPSSGAGHTILIADCDNNIIGYAVNNQLPTPPVSTPPPAPQIILPLLSISNGVYEDTAPIQPPAPVLPKLSISNGVYEDIAPPPPAPPVTPWLIASGAKLSNGVGGESAMLKSINWYGFEQIGIPSGSWSRPFRTIIVDGVEKEGMLDEIKRLGFNSLRMLFSQDCTWPGYKPVTESGHWNTTYIDSVLNPWAFLETSLPADRFVSPQPVKNTIDIMDWFVDQCAMLGLRIIFDMHTLAPDDDNVAATNGKWYTTATPDAIGTTTGAKREPRNEAQAIAAFVFLADRYKNKPIVCGFDLINEPHECTWDRDPTTGVVGYYERCGNAIHAVNPNVMIICEGIAERGMNSGTVDHTPPGHENDQASKDGKYKWGTVWSGKLDEVSRIANVQVTLNIPNKVIYSPHEYGSYPAGYKWFYPEQYVGSTYAGLPFPDNMPNVWSREWGYLAEQDIAPVWIGEFGSYLRVGGDPIGHGGSSYSAQQLIWDKQWLTALANYCNKWKIGFSFWALNPGGDPDGLLSENGTGQWASAQDFKVTALQPFLNPPQSSP